MPFSLHNSFSLSQFTPANLRPAGLALNCSANFKYVGKNFLDNSHLKYFFILVKTFSIYGVNDLLIL